MKIDNKGRVLFFSEKPKGDDLKAMVIIVSHTLKDIPESLMRFQIDYSKTNIYTLGGRHNCFRTISRRG